MKRVAALAGLLGCASGVITFSRTVTQVPSYASGKVTLGGAGAACTGSDQYGSNDCTLQWGGAVDITYDVALTQDFPSGSVSADMKIDGLISWKPSCKVCGENCTLKIPVIGKEISFATPACPIPATTLSNTTTQTLPAAPSGLPKTSVKGTLSVTDSTGATVGGGSFEAHIDSSVTSFEGFKAMHQKVYANAAEEALRKAIFEENMAKAAKLSAAEPSATFGATPFADLSETEFSTYHNAGEFFAKANRSEWEVMPLYSAQQVAAAEATAIDWRSKGAVTPVKNQGQCGSCWAFSTTGNIEGQWFLAGNKLVSLSEMQLVDCDRGLLGDKGCNGGLPTRAYKYIKKAGGLELEADYKYTAGTGKSGTCQFAKSKAAVTISGGKVLASDEGQMLTFVQSQGPLSVGVYAAGSAWQTYTGGILKTCSTQRPDHAVLIVGYGTEGTTPYWIVKNSWGTSWGEQGYIRI
eukprot:Hpha_TRINITY_DN16488_c1_g10::TRINITY_DN16488_c1_g10_i1::g.163209::m.163209/K01373/CTSF; cathepsin F